MSICGGSCASNDYVHRLLISVVVFLVHKMARKGENIIDRRPQMSGFVHKRKDIEINVKDEQERLTQTD